MYPNNFTGGPIMSKREDKKTLSDLLPSIPDIREVYRQSPHPPENPNFSWDTTMGVDGAINGIALNPDDLRNFDVDKGNALVSVCVCDRILYEAPVFLLIGAIKPLSRPIIFAHKDQVTVRLGDKVIAAWLRCLVHEEV